MKFNGIKLLENGEVEEVIEIEYANVTDDGTDIERTRWQQFRTFVGKYNVSLTIAICVAAALGGCLWTTLPAPYGLHYRMDVMTKTASFICVDGTYSFASGKKGTCAGRGGILHDVRTMEAKRNTKD